MIVKQRPPKDDYIPTAEGPEIQIKWPCKASYLPEPEDTKKFNVKVTLSSGQVFTVNSTDLEFLN